MDNKKIIRQYSSELITTHGEMKIDTLKDSIEKIIEVPKSHTRIGFDILMSIGALIFGVSGAIAFVIYQAK